MLLSKEEEEAVAAVAATGRRRAWAPLSREALLPLVASELEDPGAWPLEHCRTTCRFWSPFHFFFLITSRFWSAASTPSDRRLPVRSAQTQVCRPSRRLDPSIVVSGFHQTFIKICRDRRGRSAAAVKCDTCARGRRAPHGL